MVRLFAFLIGAFFSGMLLLSFGGTLYSAITDPAAPTAESVYHKHPKEVSFSFDGPMGKYDKRQLQRGLKVYSEVCSACHSMKLVAFRDFAALGYNEDQVKAIAKG